MIQLHTLGSTELNRPDGTAAASVLAQAEAAVLQHSPVFHGEQDLASLHGYPPFEALMRPR